MTKVAVLGAGSWGTTVAALISSRAATTLWARSEQIAHEICTFRTNATYLADHRLPEALGCTSSLEEALDEATLVVVAVPSHGVRAVLDEAVGFIVPTLPVLSLTKGLEQESLARMTEVVASSWGSYDIGVLTGPNLAAEVLVGQPTASVIAMTDEDLARDLQELFATETLRVYTNPDVVGCEIAGVVKNVMAIATGMAVGLGYGDNTRAALITRSLAELTRLGVALGGEPLTFAGLAGLGDLVATCTSMKSRNFRAGIALGEGRLLADALGGSRMVIEGLQSSRPVVALATQLGVEVPVAEQVVAVWHEGRLPSETIPHLMRRAARSELEGVGRSPGSPSSSRPIESN